MKEATGNLWDYPAQVRAITTNGFVKNNGECVMGRGCAKEARDKFPGLAIYLGQMIKAHGNRCFNLGNGLVSFPVKHNWWEKADPDLIVQSAHQLVTMADKFGWKSVVIPRPGCGNGQLNWDDVKKVIEPILDDRFTIITF